MLKKLAPIDAKLIQAIRGIDHFHVHSDGKEHDHAVLELMNVPTLKGLEIEHLYESAKRLQLSGILKNGFGGNNCFHVTSSLEALMKKIEPQG